MLDVDNDLVQTLIMFLMLVITFWYAHTSSIALERSEFLAKATKDLAQATVEMATWAKASAANNQIVADAASKTAEENVKLAKATAAMKRCLSSLATATESLYALGARPRPVFEVPRERPPGRGVDVGVQNVGALPFRIARISGRIDEDKGPPIINESINMTVLPGGCCRVSVEPYSAEVRARIRSLSCTEAIHVSICAELVGDREKITRHHVHQFQFMGVQNPDHFAEKLLPVVTESGHEGARNASGG